MLKRAVAVWIVLVFLAVAVALVRNLLVAPLLGLHWAHVIGTLIFCAVIFLVTRATISWIGPSKTKDALLIGSFWLVLTVAFEFLAGHYLFGNPWRVLLADYNFLRGRIWILVLITTFAAPLIAGRRVAR
jgi:hypothetical protein